MPSNTVVRSLYRSLLRLSRKYDKHPALKALLTSADFAQAGMVGIYTPCAPSSLSQVVTRNFRQPPEGVGIEMAFSALRYLNEINDKHFTPLYGAIQSKTLDTQPKTITALVTPSSSSSPSPTEVAESANPHTKQRKTPFELMKEIKGNLSMLAPSMASLVTGVPRTTRQTLRLEAKPVQVKSLGCILQDLLKDDAAKAAKAAKEQQQKQIAGANTATSSASAVAVTKSPAEMAAALATESTTQDTLPHPNLDAVREGVVLALHPLVSQPFPKCVMLVTRVYNDMASVLIMNFPTAVEFGSNNYVIPSNLRDQPCFIGGGIHTIQQVPPVPNYVILHPYPNIPNSRVLLPHETHPVCISTGTDISTIGKFITRYKLPKEHFRFFLGTVEVPKADLAHEMAYGLWMPLQTSTAFIHAATHLESDELWHTLLTACGGEFVHMSLLGEKVTTAAAQQ